VGKGETLLKQQKNTPLEHSRGGENKMKMKTEKAQKYSTT